MNKPRAKPFTIIDRITQNMTAVSVNFKMTYFCSIKNIKTILKSINKIKLHNHNTYININSSTLN